MPIIPDYQMPEAGNYQPSVGSTSTASAPARAAQSIAKGIEDAGQVFAGVAVKVAEAKDRGNKANAEMRLLRARDEHEQWRLQNPDENGWEADWQSRLGEAKGDIDQLEVSPLLRTELDLAVQGFEQREGAKVMGAKLTQTTQRARQASANLYERHVKDKNGGEARRVIAESALLPEEKEARILDLEDEEKRWQAQDRYDSELTGVMADPVAWMAKNPPNKVPEGMDPSAYGNLQGEARQQLRMFTADTSAAILDGLAAGKITKPEEIEAMGQGLRPSVIAGLKAQLEEMGRDGYRAKIASPEYEKQVTGEVLEMLGNYKAEGDDFDEALVAMDAKVRTLPEGSAAKAELKRRVEQVRYGQLQEIESAEDLPRRALGELYKAGAFGTAKKQLSVDEVMAAGLLKDTVKLQGRGFTADEAKEIAGIKDGWLQMLRYKELSKKRVGRDYSDPFNKTAFDLLESPRDAFMEYEDEAAKRAAREAFGDAKIKLEEWIKFHPDAARDEQKSRDKVRELIAPTAKKDFSAYIVAEEPPADEELPVPDEPGSVLPEKPNE